MQLVVCADEWYSLTWNSTVDNMYSVRRLSTRLFCIKAWKTNAWFAVMFNLTRVPDFLFCDRSAITTQGVRWKGKKNRPYLAELIIRVSCEFKCWATYSRRFDILWVYKSGESIRGNETSPVESNYSSSFANYAWLYTSIRIRSIIIFSSRKLAAF